MCTRYRRISIKSILMGIGIHTYHYMYGKSLRIHYLIYWHLIIVFFFNDIRWSKVWGLTDMGFAREKTTYCYFAIASSSDFHYDSDIRLVVAKSAVLITVFDDFFDMEGSLDDLQTLADAVQRYIFVAFYIYLVCLFLQAMQI